MSQSPNLPSHSHLEDACGHLVFKNFAFLVYALKETDGENHRGKSQQNTASPGSSIPNVTI